MDIGSRKSSPGRRAAFWLALVFLSGILPGRAAGERTAFPGSLAPIPGAAQWQRASSRRGVQSMEVEIALRMRHLEELQARIGRGEILDRAEMERRYLPLEANYAALEKWCAQEGLEITARNPARLSLFVRGSVARLEQSFLMEIGEVRQGTYLGPAARSAPSLPGEVAAGVLGINGLQPYIMLRKSDVISQVHPAGPETMGVAQVLGAYNGLALGATGAGQTIAILIDALPLGSDLEEFWRDNAIPQSLANIEEVNVSGTTLDGPFMEETLDTQWASGMAPGARVRVYATGSLAFVSLNKALGRILEDRASMPGLQQLSISLGIGETYVSAATLAAEAQYFAALAASGISVFASSGDEGSNPDDVNDGLSGGPRQTAYFSSDPSVTAVGGTALPEAFAEKGSRVEVAWKGSGGGASAVFARPSWQRGPGVIAGKTRLVPDVSAVGSVDTPGLMVFKGERLAVAGTSWSTPIWAGFCACINEARQRAGLPPLGLLNVHLYPLLGTRNFRDILEGDNGAYEAGPGYDLVSGLGSPDMGELLRSLSGSAPAAQIKGIAPMLGAPGAVVILRGGHLEGAQAVEFNGVPAPVLFTSATQIRAAVPDGALSGPVRVRMAGGQTLGAGDFRVSGEAGAASAGVFSALLESPSEKKAGALQLAVTRGGQLSGQLRKRGGVHRFAGSFSAKGTFQKEFSEAGQVWRLDLNFIRNGGSARLAGALSVAGQLVAWLETDAAPVFSPGHPSPRTGLLTFLLPPDPERFAAPEFPQGCGFGRMRVGWNGMVRLSGRLGDGQPFAAGARSAGDGGFGVFAGLYGRQRGELAGNVRFENRPGQSDCAGLLRWKRPWTETGGYPAGFEWEGALLIGSIYRVPLPGERVLGWVDGAGRLTLGAENSEEFSGIDVRLSDGNALAVEGANGRRINLSVHAGSGFFSGSFTDAAGGGRREMRGVLFEAGAMGGGQWMVAGRSAPVFLKPR